MKTPANPATTDPFGLDRFVDAQSRVYADAVDELRDGHKQTHWMWFVFPQFEGLGNSAMSRRYAIRSIDEARAYLGHALLGARLAECTQIVNQHDDLSAMRIFGAPDDMKFRSSMTLFEVASERAPRFTRALDTYFAGERDARTLQLMRAAGATHGSS